MQQKKDSSTGEQSLERGNIGLTLSDKYVALQFENKKLKWRIRAIGEAFHEWREKALQYQAERYCLREQLQEQAQERVNHE